MRYVLLVGRTALGAVFLYAAYTKLRQPWLLFALSIDAYRLLPEWAVLGLARVLPWLELAIGVALLAGVKPRITAFVSTLLLGGFLAVMIRSYSAGMGIDCGCFGLGEALTWKTLARDSLLFGLSFGLAIVAWRARRPLPATDRAAIETTRPPG